MIKPVCAIDPSHSATALCWGGQPDREETEVFTSKNRGDDVAARVKRNELLVHRIDDRLREIDPALILIEQYSYGSNDARAKYSAEFGGILRWHLVEHAPVLEVAPNTLKKFATGTGKGKKEFVMAHVQKRWDRIFPTNDECDAYVLWRMALIIAGLATPEIKAQEEAIETVMNGVSLNLESGTVKPDDEIPF